MGSGRDEDALSEIVGFVLVLALIVVASTLYLMYVVPAEGREDEIEQMNQVQDRFVSYKTSVDGLWLRSVETNFVAPDTGGVSLSTSFDLGTGGGNTQSGGLFLSFMRPIGTAAKMRTQKDTEPVPAEANDWVGPEYDWIGVRVDNVDHLNTTYDGARYPLVPVGSLSYHTDNYYWIQQNYYYKLGGVFLEQPKEGVSVKVAPPIAIYRVTNASDPTRPTVKASLSLINITSDKSTVGGTGPLRVETRLRESMRSPYQDEPVGDVVLHVYHPEPEWVEAWEQVFVDAVRQSGLPTDHLYDDTNEWFRISNPGANSVQLQIRHRGVDTAAYKDVYLDLNEATLQVTFEYDEP